MQQIEYSEVLYKYQLEKDFQINLFSICPFFYVSKEISTEYFRINYAGLLTIFSGYCWDGATGGIDTDNFLVPSLVHDVLCQIANEKLLGIENTFSYKDFQFNADYILKELCKRYGMSKIRVYWVFNAVRIFQRNKKEYKKVIKKSPKKLK